MRIAFDENTPIQVARAIRILAESDARGGPDSMEVLHALDLVAQGTLDVTLIEAVTRGASGPAALITTDKAIRTRQHERAAFRETGCIGIVLRGQWSHASLWDRARLTLLWWTTWVALVDVSPPGALWQSPWSGNPKPLKSF